MKSLDALLIAIRLLYLEKTIEKENGSNSKELVQNILDLLDNEKRALNGSNKEMIQNLKEYVRTFVDMFDKTEYEPNLIKQSLLLILENKDLIEELIADITRESTLEEKQQRILRLRSLLSSYYGEDKLKKLLNKLTHDINNKRNKITDIEKFRLEALSMLETIKLGNVEKDPNIVTEIDLSDVESSSQIIHELQDEASSGLLLKTGFQAMNRVLDGGIRRGELITITSQQHKYKSGLARSLFMQTMIHNVPKLKDENKKPLMIFISFEDNARLVLKFMFEYLMSSEGKTTKIMDVSSDDAAAYIKGALEANGWNVKLLVVNPSGWGYKDIFNTVEKYESKGFEVFGLCLDYLSLVPKIGCINNGATGSDTRDLFRRVGNYGRARDMYVITPHQSSSGVKLLLRNGVTDEDLVKEIYGKGYFADSSQLDQEHDVGILGHIAKIDGESYLTLAVDKHRGFVINQEYAFFSYKFPKNEMPIPPDINGKDMSIKDLSVSGDDDLF